MSDPISVLVAHAHRTLPDSITERRKLLAAMFSAMAAGHPAYKEVAAELKAVKSAMEFQARAQLKFQNLNK